MRLEGDSLDLAGIRRRVAEINWYHTIDLGNGIVTPGKEDSRRRLKRIGLPDDLSGVSVLDIGAWDGFYSFEAERRGARRVLATDSFCWGGPGWGTKAGFDLAREVLDSKVEDQEIDVMQLTPDAVGAFDLVLFLGVLYHLRHPLLALERVLSVTAARLILETHVDLLWLRRPAMAFYPGSEIRKDPTNWWGPNPAALTSMLRDVGFRRIQVVARPYPLLFRAARSARSRDGLRGLRQARVTLHAWR